ncbi:DUF4214 domain-containing protein [Amorphus sp. 3PC139-8]|uniref:DUF4214 domain-containing protein n=1 Tax=Amorphus sp. 3PC139-8 TaxID=2735676 RepID=UPI00345D6BE0
MAFDIYGLSVSEQVTASYVAFFGRAPDPGGLNYWIGVYNDFLAEGQTEEQILETIINYFSADTEGVAQYPQLATPNLLVGNPTAQEAFITEIYQNLFNRDPDAAGLDFWTDQLVSLLESGEGVGNLVMQIAGGAQDSPDGQDATTYQNKISVGLTYANSYVADGVTWTNAQLQQAHEIVDNTTDSNLTEQTAAAEAAPTAEGTGDAFFLTINQDTLTGTAGNDTFTANVVATGVGTLADTLQSVDTLDGGAGTDLLTATLNGSLAAPTLTSIENLNLRSVASSSLDLNGASGIAMITVANGTGDLAIGNIGDVSSLVVKNQSTDVDFHGVTAETVGLELTNYDSGVSFLSNAPSTLNLTVTNVDAVVSSPVAGAFGTLTVAATGENDITFGGATDDITSVTVTGEGSVDFFTGTNPFDGDFTKFDASENSGGVEVGIASNEKAAVTGGSGDDTVYMDTTVQMDSTLDLGEGDDTALVGDQLANFASVAGGDGTDTIGITDGSTLTKATGANISGFEILEIGGGQGTYNFETTSFDTVQATSALSGSTTLSNVEAGFEFDVMSSDSDLALGSDQTIALKDATGSNDAVTLDVSINDSSENTSPEGNVTFSTSTTINDVESITVDSTVDTLPTDQVASDYSTTFDDLIADSVETLTLTGDSDIVFSAFTNSGNTLTKVDASGSTGDVTLDVSTVTSKVAYTGSEGVDTYTAGSGGGAVYGGQSNDQITLDSGSGARNVISYKSADDTTLTVDAEGDIEAGSSVETVNDFTAGSGLYDLIDVTGFDFSGYEAATLDKGTFAVSLTGGDFDASIDDFFADAGGDRGVAFGIYDTGGGIYENYVFVDANGDGNFTATDDVAFQVNGAFGMPISSDEFLI